MDKVNIPQERWDYLLILDACRYDYFEDMYPDYLKGTLSKKISRGSCTDQWRDESFPGIYDDIVFISANPMISGDNEVYGYRAGDHFHKVYDVWQDHWHVEKGTVLPEDLNRAALEIMPRHSGKRFIVHYIQPHEPYLLPELPTCGWDQGDMEKRSLIGAEKYQRFMPLKQRLHKNLLRIFKNTRILTNYPDWILRQWLHMPPRSAMDYVRRYYGRDMLRKAYRYNLDYVLQAAAELVRYLSGTIVVSADHGEFLGENRCYAHPCRSDHPTLIEVPWLTIEQDRAEQPFPLAAHKDEPPTTTDPAEKQNVTDKLKALGYFD